jgi:hypothetical protein
VGSHEISPAAGVSRATSYRWRNSKEEILFDACFDHVKPTFAISGSGAGLARLREFSLRATDLLSSIDGQVIARLVTGIHEDKTLRRMYLNKFVIPIRQIQRNIIQGVIIAGELKRTTDPELLMDALNGPPWSRWLRGHAPLDKNFAEHIWETSFLLLNHNDWG